MVAMRMISLLAAMLLLGSCTGTEFESTLEDHRATWVAAGLGAYEYELTLDCFCPSEVAGPFRVSVVGSGAEVTRVGSPDSPVAVDEIVDGTIESIFEFVEEHTDADFISVTYDEQLGYPTTVVVDPSESILDDEMSITVHRFRSTGS